MEAEVGGVEVITEIGSNGDECSDMAFLVELRGLQEADVPSHASKGKAYSNNSFNQSPLDSRKDVP